ncbi:MAG: hypothetical protein IKW90_07160 [Lachnospiraceae bacterium]|nr:hypothetical protein [Lachnospiraceae bacterium]
MRKKIIVLIISVVLASAFFGSGMYVGAATKSGAGSQNDPVVSLSYLEYRLGQLEGKTGTSNSTGAGQVTSETTGYEKITIGRGERSMPGEGGVIVLYSGACTVVGKGVMNITSGTIITEGSTVPAYSQILVPDRDSGVVASESTVLFVLYGE